MSKKDRRHELAENSLAKWLYSVLESLKPYQNHIYWTCIGILVVICIGMVWTRVFQSSRATAWNAYLSAVDSRNVEKLQELTGDYESGEVGVRIRLSLGEFYLNDACNLIMENKPEAYEKVENALENFLQAKKLNKADHILGEQILFGLGQTYEIFAILRTGQGDVESAIDSYTNLVGNYPGGVFAEEAQHRIGLLQSPKTRDFYTFLANRSQESGDPTFPGSILDGATLPDPGQSFDLPDDFLQVPEGAEDIDFDALMDDPFENPIPGEAPVQSEAPIQDEPPILEEAPIQEEILPEIPPEPANETPENAESPVKSEYPSEADAPAESENPVESESR